MHALIHYGVTSDTARILFQTFLQDSYQSLGPESDTESDVNSINLSYTKKEIA